MKVLLNPQYKKFCMFESIAINGVGCTSLVFQDTLRENTNYPGLYEYWFTPPIPQTESEYLMAFMIAAWLTTAGLLQAFINFDPLVPKRTKLAALYSFFLCDWLWIILMIKYTELFSIYHIVGSMYTIAIRTKFIVSPHLLFQNSTCV